MSDDKVVKFPSDKDEGVNIHVINLDSDDVGIAMPFICYPGRDDVSGVAARAAMLRFADIIAHENLEAATSIRKGIIAIEAEFGNPTK